MGNTNWYKFRSSRISTRSETKVDGQAFEGFLAKENPDLGETPDEIKVEPLNQSFEALGNQKLSTADKGLPSKTKDEYHGSPKRHGRRLSTSYIVGESPVRRNKPRER